MNNPVYDSHSKSQMGYDNENGDLFLFLQPSLSHYDPSSHLSTATEQLCNADVVCTRRTFIRSEYTVPRCRSGENN
eukprot:758053-Hanusia_phi.AAC.5